MEGAVVVLFDMSIDWVSKSTSTLCGELTSEPVLPGAAWAVLRAAAAAAATLLGLATLGVVPMARTTAEAGLVTRDMTDDCFFVLEQLRSRYPQQQEKANSRSRLELWL